MSEWNERIEKARLELFENIANRKNPGHPANLGDVMNHIDNTLTALKDPEPDILRDSQLTMDPLPLPVKNPDGKVWYCDSGGKYPHLFNHESHPCATHCYAMKPNQAFVLGAVVQWAKKGCKIEGTVIQVFKPGLADGGSVEIHLVRETVCRYIDELTLVKPAPEASS